MQFFVRSPALLKQFCSAIETFGFKYTMQAENDGFNIIVFSAHGESDKLTAGDIQAICERARLRIAFRPSSFPLVQDITHSGVSGK